MPIDPLLQSDVVERSLFEKVKTACANHMAEHVAGVAINLLVNVLRQQHNRRRTAHEAMDRAFHAAKDILDKHYDPVTQRRRSVFPFTQVIQAGKINATPGKSS